MPYIFKLIVESIMSFNIDVTLQLILEAIPKDETDQARRYRGYIAVDDLYFDSGEACQGHCTFDSGMCGFLNDNSRDDFDWKVVSCYFRVLRHDTVW